MLICDKLGNPETVTGLHTLNKKPSLADVATLAGVSVATVSRVLNTPAIVTAELREKVLKATRALGYVPHGAARALASNRTRSVGVVVPTLGISIFARGVESMQDRLGEDGYRLLVANSQYNPAKELQEIESLLAHGVDGLVLVGNERLPEARKLLRQFSCPVIITFVHEAAEEFPAVGVNNFSSSYDMTKYLVESGHTHFSILTSPVQNNDRVRARRDGILSCLKDYNQQVTLHEVFEIPYSMQAGGDGLDAIVKQAPLTSSIVCTTDLIAVGAMARARSIGLSVPEDVSIAGYDGLELANYLTPALTTISVPASEIGRLAAQRMLDELNGAKAQTNTIVETSLSIRGSTASPRPNRLPLDAIIIAKD
ncbi:LacI family DNA-binding transcriptional regulator [Pelagibacterium luteolum]|uniref:Transcriptional regulator, LacI family n=1 Tax=Pelagibacterium luteolum TaxID=440168 RepID=A0A1G7XIR1_9HYPH|nr:transcriptional regulator, LacI family [Pelagibacterium luteolum]